MKAINARRGPRAKGQMRILSSLIFALLLLVQAWPAGGATPCAGQPAREVRMPVCPCCAKGGEGIMGGIGDSSGGCPAKAAACCCGQPQDTPTTPPSDTTVKKLTQVLGTLPTLAVTLAPAPPPHTGLRPTADPAAHRAASSIHAVLCVWVL